ncbi:aldehyde ferredoxin oxidoreductase [Halobacteriales archaeon QS_1_68_17]|nr:MAG: aldehyde ferredoxin oxidoreductase [Halobacteriales archaeon QS_1_68_17]
MDYELPTRLLRVDLSAGTVDSERVPAAWRRDFVGGKGLGARYLYEELDGKTDPLGPGNALLFLRGPLTGVLPGEARFAVVTKSPLTGTFLDSYSGGAFAEALAGGLGEHVGLLVTGRAADPVRIDVAGGTASLAPAADLWGLDARETDAAVPDAEVACAGPAGENLVAYATVASEGGDHQAGRGGAGAVMGAKRLKTVTARGDPPDDPAFAGLRERFTVLFADDADSQWFLTSETLESVDFANEVGALSTRGWQESRFEGTDDIGIESVHEAASGRERADDPIPGGFRVETRDGESVPRGATQITLGAGLGIDDFDAVATLGEQCDRLGVDVISAGTAVAWAIRAAGEGVIDRDLSFGDPGDARGLLDEIAARSTLLGDALAEGIETAAGTFGGADLVPTAKGMELPGYDPRGATSMALAYATSDRGPCHRRSRPVEQEAFVADPWDAADVAAFVIEEQDARSLLWSLIADDFAGMALWDSLGAEWLAAVGLDYDPAELRATGDRIWNLTRLFNVRAGFTRADDRLPPMLAGAIGDSTDGPVRVDSFAAMLDAYYDARGWSADGVPTRGTLDRLDLLEAVDDETPVAGT